MKNKKIKLDLNEQFTYALDLMGQSRKNLFITGRAGTGKSTLLNFFRDQTKKNLVVLAPTGVAAINVRGQTIHSFFRFRPDITVEKIKKVPPYLAEIYKKIDAIIIDEISMVRADILDCIDIFMRLNGPDKMLPFGGVQMIFFGDLYQLPPVVTSREEELFSDHYSSPYFFSAHVFEENSMTTQPFVMEFIELEKIYRQSDQKFIDALNTIRNNSATDKELEYLNSRYDPNFESDSDDFFIYLTSTNAAASAINQEQLETIDEDEHFFTAEIRGEFDKQSFPTDPELHFKIGAQIMLLNNDSAGRWVNGTIGKIIGVEEIEPNEEGEGGERGGAAELAVIAELDNGETVSITPHRWDIYEYHYDRDTKHIDSDTVGSFTQYPFRLAWAITIHKSQGKTFERAVVDVGRGTFAHGQMYVALSRCTSLEGLILKKRLLKSHIIMDWRVVKFVTNYQYSQAHREQTVDDKVVMLEKAIKDRATLTITYLKNSDVKSKRQIKPLSLGQEEYMDKKFLGLRAFCLERQSERMFRVDRILKIEL